MLESENGVKNRLVFTVKDSEILRSLFEDMIVGKSLIVKAIVISKLKITTR